MGVKEKKIKVTEKMAIAEVDGWLDYRSVDEEDRFEEKEEGEEGEGEYSASVRKMINGVKSGVLSINPKNQEITHKLKFPIENKEGVVTVTELKYKSRANVGEFNHAMKGVKAGDGNGRILSYEAVLTGQPKGILKALDSFDGNIAQAIALFFMG